MNRDDKKHGKNKATAPLTRAAALLLCLALLLCSCAAQPAATVLAAEPTPAPTQKPPEELTFAEDDFLPLPTKDEYLALGEGQKLRGVVSSNYALTSIKVSITCYRSEDPFYPYEKYVHFDAKNVPSVFPVTEVFKYDFTETNTREGVSLDSLVKFSELGVGLHTMVITARSTEDRSVKLAETSFYILGEDWEKLSSANFSGTYGETLSFFKDRERFLYKYQWVWDRYIIADPEWEAEYIVAIPREDTFGGRDWLIHRDALPYYQKALGYLKTARVRISGTNGDTGILPLSELIYTYNGSYVPRYMSNKKYISLHSFGTATDINAAMTPNLNNAENLTVIFDDVSENLTYNGIKTEGETQYYDFTYSGTYQTAANGVPETCANYLLYELAFYRAGFQWGHYYNSVSDGMHFTLTDKIGRAAFSSGSRALRKVREYYE